jgi:hypothetical protein
MFDRDKDDKLRNLLRLKKFEMPSEDKWAEFDCSFENRRLSAMKESVARRALSILSLNFKRVAYASAAFLLILVAYFAVGRGGSAADIGRMAKEASMEYVKFASDDMVTQSVGANEKLNVDSMYYSYDGVEYIRDMLTMRKDSSLLAKM